MYYNEPVEGEDKSKFNAAIATLKRIDEAKRVMMDCILANNYDNWYKCICFIRGAVNGKMKPDERIKADTYEELIDEVFNPKRDYTITTPYFAPKRPKMNTIMLRHLLKQYEYFLTDIEEKRGMGLVDEDEDDGL